jgi:ParB-like chromosome segregation protein Spo0J
MAEICIPNPEVVATSQLKADGKNPNKMTRDQLDRLKTSIKKFGFIVPIITNKDLLIADGEQRWIAANELAMPNVLVVRLPVEEVDRRLLRQVLNKLRGEHDLLLDADEFEQILQLGGQDDLKYLLEADKDTILLMRENAKFPDQNVWKDFFSGEDTDRFADYRHIAFDVLVTDLEVITKTLQTINPDKNVALVEMVKAWK